MDRAGGTPTRAQQFLNAVTTLHASSSRLRSDKMSSRCRWWMIREDGTNAVRIFTDDGEEEHDRGLVVCLTAGIKGNVINVISII